jgi:multidrug efflux system membrane fusion protein
MKRRERNTFITLLIVSLLLTNPVHAEEFKGSLAWSKRVAISTPVSGVITEVYANAGDKVPSGEKLLQLEDEVFKANVASTYTASQNRIAEYEEAQREVDRMQELYDRTMLSDHDLQTAKNKLIKAKALKAQAAANHKQARHDLKYSTVRAPFDAVVLERRAQPGQVISSRLQPEPLFVLAEANHMLARIYVPENWLAKLGKDKPAEVVVNGITYNGKVLAVGLEPAKSESNNSSYPVDIQFEHKDQVLRAGQQANVILQ